MLEASSATPWASAITDTRQQAALPHSATARGLQQSRVKLMKRLRSYTGATQQALLGNVSLGTRNFNTMQASQPSATVQVLEQWQQEVHDRQNEQARQHSMAGLSHPRKLASRRRRNQRLHIVPRPEQSSGSRAQASQLATTSQLPDLHKPHISHTTSTFGRPDIAFAKMPAERRQKPSGSNLRSLATPALLLSHASLLQQLQQTDKADATLTIPTQGGHAMSADGRPKPVPAGVDSLLTATQHTSSVMSQVSKSAQSNSESKHAHTADQHGHTDLARHSGDAELDTMSLTLDIVDNQLPHWSHKQPLDWSAEHDQTFYQPQLRVVGDNKHNKHILTKFSMTSQGEQLDIQPLWIAVHQEQPGGPARLYETVHSLQPEVLEHIPEAVQPFCLAEGMTFVKPQFSHGAWKGYLVGVVGDVAAEEDNVLWPNRLFSGKRVMHNVRNGWDIAKFLAEPTLQDMQGHHVNLKLLQEDRNYQPGWVWHMLNSRWGEEAVTAFSSAQAAEQVAVQQQATAQKQITVEQQLGAQQQPSAQQQLGEQQQVTVQQLARQQQLAAHQQTVAPQRLTVTRRRTAHPGVLQQARLRMAAQRTGIQGLTQRPQADVALQCA